MIPRQGKKTLQHKLTDLWKDKVHGAPYNLGGMSKEEGFDCLSLVVFMLWELGADILPFYSRRPLYAGGRQVRRAGDIDLTNYWQDYDLSVLPDWFSTLGEEIHINFRRPGDLFLCKFRRERWMISLYLGNEHCAIINGETQKAGVCPFCMLKEYIVEARRCRI